MRIITIASLKGGVGKTTLTAGLAVALSKSARVVALDFDGQASLTDYLLRDTETEAIEYRNSYHLLTERAEPRECVHPSALNLSVIPASPQLHLVTAEMSSDPGSVLRLRKELETLGADIVLIDTPPSLTYESRAGFFSADIVLSPVNTDRWTLQGYALLLSEIHKVEKTLSRRVPVIACPSIVSASEALTIKAGELFMPMSKTAIHKAAAVRSAMQKASRLKESSKAALEFDALASEIMGAL